MTTEKQQILDALVLEIRNQSEVLESSSQELEIESKEVNGCVAFVNVSLKGNITSWTEGHSYMTRDCEGVENVSIDEIRDGYYLDSGLNDFNLTDSDYEYITKNF